MKRSLQTQSFVKDVVDREGSTGRCGGMCRERRNVIFHFDEYGLSLQKLKRLRPRKGADCEGNIFALRLRR